MERKKKRLTDERREITVRTLANGYTLDVKGGDGWMYETEDELFKGLIYHVRMGMMRDVEKRTLDDMYTAMMTWPNASDATIKAANMEASIKRLMDTVARQSATIKKQQKRVRELNSLNEALRDEIKEFKKKESHCVTRKDLDKRPKVPKPQPAKLRTTISETAYKALLTPLTMKDTGMGRRTIGTIRYVGGKENHCIGDIARLRRSAISGARGAGIATMTELDKYFMLNDLTFGMDVEAVLAAYQKNK